MKYSSMDAGKEEEEGMKVFNEDTAVAVLTRYAVKEGYAAKFRQAVRGYVQDAIAQKSPIMAEAYYEDEHPSVFWIIERWSSPKALEENRTRARFKHMHSLSKEMLAAPARVMYVKDLEPLSRDEWQRKPGKDDAPITIMLFVDCKPGTEDTFTTIYHTAMPQFRGEPGVVNYQLSRVEGDSSQFVTYEQFRNEAAFQYHLKFPPIQPILDYLNTSIKQQPFQRGLHRLIALTDQ